MLTRRRFMSSALGSAILAVMAVAGGISFSEAKQMNAKCAECPMRARYDANPKSFISRIWKWHTRWCPGWKNYLLSLPAGEREEIQARYR